MNDLDARRYLEGRLFGLRSARYSWWVHWREVADYFLPRRYRWLVSAGQNNRGSPINQHIFDSSGVLAARNLASGLMSGKISPSQPWLKLKVNRIDSTGTTATSLWLGECERLMRLVFQTSNFYTSVAQWLADLVTFGTGALVIHDDFDNVINCSNPCAGEYFVDLDGKFRPRVFYREFTMTLSALVSEFGIENVPENLRRVYEDPKGAGLSQEVVVCHAIEPNDDGRDLGTSLPFREHYWVNGSAAQTDSGASQGFLRTRGYHEQAHIVVRWDIVSNDAYGRSPAMDALPDQKQLQQESRRKAQAIDKMVNPPLIGDMQLKNQPASLLPGGITYINGYGQSGKGLSSIYDTKFPIGEIKEDLDEIRERIKRTFFNDLFQPISQFQTRSNITAVEINQRKSESLIMLGPVFERLDNEGLRPIVERVFGIMSRAGILPPPPPEIAGQDLDVEFVSMLALAQDAANSAGITQLLGLAGNLAGLDPTVMDGIDVDFALDNYSSLLNNDPRLMRTAEARDAIRQNRAKQQADAQQADNAQKLAASAKNLAGAPLGDGNALEALSGLGPSA